MPAIPANVSPTALRLVLFGIPDAGKSSLLGALAQAAQIQEHLLDGHLTDLSQGLTALQRRLYEERPRETLEEVIPYPTVFEPFATGAAKREVVLFDCDGRAANELLTRRRALEDGSAETSLAFQILEADTLLLVVDASASPAQVDADFAEFGRFLRFLQQSRGRRTAVGGLPVFLVLSKCDLLAKADDTAAAWIERIEDRKREVHQRFQDFLGGAADRPPVFGSIDLHVWATAVRRPALVGSPAKPHEPYGVAELFRQAFAEAAAFQKREEGSSRRLWWTAGGAAAVLAAMLGLATAFVANRQSADLRDLESRVETIKAREQGEGEQRPAGRLAEWIRELERIKNDRDFSQLPQEQQDYVNQLLHELEAYQDYLARITSELASIPPPPPVGEPAPPLTEDDLKRWQTRLEELAPPPEYRQRWEETRAVRLRKERLDDYQALDAAVQRQVSHWRNLSLRGERLWTFADWRPDDPRDRGEKWSDWKTQVQQLFAAAEQPVEGPAEKLRPDGPPIAALVPRFQNVQKARADWERLKQQLSDLRDLSTALGLPQKTPSDAAVLSFDPGEFKAFDVISATNPTGGSLDPGPLLEKARRRFKELQRLYPRYAEWPQLKLPEAVAPIIRQAAERGYRAVVSRTPESVNGLGQQVILRQLQQVSPDGKETGSHWDEVRRWLTGSPAELAGWRELATLLAQLRTPGTEDPVADLANFLGDRDFKVDLRGGVTLAIPDELNLPVTGELTVKHTSNGSTTKLTFVQRGAENSDGKVTRYNFEPKSAVKEIEYKRDDDLKAELSGKDQAGRAYTLRWIRGRSELYQFEHLLKPPLLDLQGKSDKKEGITLTWRSGSEDRPAVPRLPELLPVVVLSKP